LFFILFLFFATILLNLIRFVCKLYANFILYLINMKPLTQIILDTRRSKSDKRFPLKLRLTYARKQKYFPLGLDLTIEEYDKIRGEKPRGEYKDLLIKINGFEEKAVRIIESLSRFSFEKFEIGFFDKPLSEKSTLPDFYNDYINQLKSEGRIKTAQNYNDSLKSLQVFNPKVSFDCITPEFLSKYEAWMIEKGKSVSTVGFYLRPLRTIINEAIEKKAFSRDDYPFIKKRYQIPSSRNIKKALNKEDLRKLLNYSPTPFSSTDKAKDFWVFSYLCNGINFKDIAYLKWRDINDDRIFFIRNKTKRTKKLDVQPIVIPLLEEAKGIIVKWGNKEKEPGNYIFNIIDKEMSPETIEKKIHQFIKTTNYWNRKLAGKLEIKADMTTYYARHTFSTMMKRMGASTELIREQLGQSSTKVTENYLDSFEDDVKREFAGKLVNF